jgi:predicted  nucleic acid-binding Zn-ribbon protein
MGLNDALRELFLVDQQLRGMESRVTGASKHVRVQQIKLDQLQQQAAELKEQLKHAEAEAHNLETEASAADDRIEHLREQMNSVKTNKEYSAMLVEVNTIKADKSKVEEHALEVMSKVELLRGELDQLHKSLEDQQKIKELADRDLSERNDEVGEQLAELKARREEAAARVADEPLQVFEKLNEAYDGEAMAPVIEEDRRRLEYTCGGCYMSIPIEKVNQLMTVDEITRCSSCGRILYMEKQLKEEMRAS